MSKPERKKLTRKQRRFIKKWLTALRSGRYEQTDSYLRTSEGFCCLGVACDLKGAEWKLVNRTSYFGPDYYKVVKDYSYLAVDATMMTVDGLEELTGLEYTEKETAKFSTEDEGSTFTGHLAIMNDDGKSFKQIANSIEHRAEKLHPGWSEGL